MTIYVGNLHNESTQDELRILFEPFGVVESIEIHPMGKTGFAIVTMPNDPEGNKAIQELFEVELHGLSLTVNECGFEDED